MAGLDIPPHLVAANMMVILLRSHGPLLRAPPTAATTPKSQSTTPRPTRPSTRTGMTKLLKPPSSLPLGNC